MYPHRFLYLLLAILSLSLLAITGDRPPASVSPETKAALSAALTHRLQAPAVAESLTLDLFTPELDTAFVSPGGKTAVMWLALRDDSGRLLATEPGLTLAQLTDAGWQVLLPGDPGWEDTLASVRGMLPLEQSPAPNNITPATAADTAALTGYYLPYAAGTARRLEGSISHFLSGPDDGYPSCTMDACHYAYDFGGGGHFPLLASKDGTVYATRDTCSDGDTGCTNYFVLRDTSGPTYQLYLHLAHGTIPDKLTSGTSVRRGQYLGDSDDTGYSTSDHVHFMVINSIWVGGDGYYWGNSVNIHFADVAVNNGVPRTCYEVTHLAIYDGATQCLGSRSDPLNPANDWFVSGNVGAYPPTGSYTRPSAGQTVGIGVNPLMDVTAKVSDDVRVTAVRMVAKMGGLWVEIGPKVTQPIQPGVFDWDVNLCAVGPLNGPLELALRVWDYEGNMAAAIGSLTVQVDHACPPPVSQLGPVETFDSTAVNLGWDVINAGIGLGSFDLQWRTEPGTWDAANLLTFPASQRSTWFVGQPGVTYAFRLRALDTNNQPEPWPAADAPEISVTLPATCTPDTFEPDDDLAQAGALVSGEWAQANLCGAGNPDWFKAQIGNARGYFVSVLSQSGGAAVSLTIYAEDGTTVLAISEAAGVGQGTELFFQPAAAGTYYIKVEPLVANLMGTDAAYSIYGAEAKPVFLPLVLR